MADIQTLRRCLSEARTIACVGMSDKPYRPSYFVGKYLLDHDYRMIPVNPTRTEILGQPCYASLADIPDSIDVDMVDCFRRPEEMPALAQQAIDIGARILWMQLGVVNEDARSLAEGAGLTVVMNRCTKIEHARLFGGLNWAGVNTRIISSRRPRHINL